MIMDVFSNSLLQHSRKAQVIALAYRIDMGNQLRGYVKRGTGAKFPVFTLFVHITKRYNSRLKRTAKTALPPLNLALGNPIEYLRFIRHWRMIQKC